MIPLIPLAYGLGLFASGFAASRLVRSYRRLPKHSATLDVLAAPQAPKPTQSKIKSQKRGA